MRNVTICLLIDFKCVHLSFPVTVAVRCVAFLFRILEVLVQNRSPEGGDPALPDSALIDGDHHIVARFECTVHPKRYAGGSIATGRDFYLGQVKR
jgi:hypothetical protein